MGSHLVDELLDRGIDVVGVDNLTGGTLLNLESARKRTKAKFTFINADCRDKNTMQNAMKGCDAVFHLAAYAAEGQSVFSPIEINDINTRSMDTLLVAGGKKKLKKNIFLKLKGGFWVHKNPLKI